MNNVDTVWLCESTSGGHHVVDCEPDAVLFCSRQNRARRENSIVWRARPVRLITRADFVPRPTLTSKTTVTVLVHRQHDLLGDLRYVLVDSVINFSQLVVRSVQNAAAFLVARALWPVDHVADAMRKRRAP